MLRKVRTNEYLFPKEIELKFRQRPGYPTMAELYCGITGALINVAPLKDISDWLTKFNYTWIVGSNGLWRRMV